MTCWLGFFWTYAAITASSNAFWNDEPPPWRVLPGPEPPPLLLPQAARASASPTTTASARGRFRVLVTSLLRAGGRGCTRGCATSAAYECEIDRSSRRRGLEMNQVET